MHRFCLPRPSGRATTGALVALALSVAAPAAAQNTLHVSTTTNVQLGPDLVDDATMIATGPVGPSLTPSPSTFFSEGHWQAVCGFVPSDIDGLGRRPSGTPGSAGAYAFSFLANEGGFLDGDVLGFAVGGGFEVIVSETELLAALGVPSANIDLDALDFDGQGCLYFSLQSDLTGTVLGMVEDGDVLCYEPATTKVSMFLTEPEIQAMFSSATGLAGSIGDVQAIESTAGVLWVVTQGPSSHDGAVLECSFNPRILVEEDEMGLNGAEIDALCDIGPSDDIPTLTMTPVAAAPGDALSIELNGDPNTIYIALLSGATGWVDFRSRPGFGAWYFDPNDPWLAMFLGPMPPMAVTDGQGSFAGSFTLPTAPVFGLGFSGEEGWSFQVMALPSLETSAPFRVTKL